jgi:hypothetical protein
MIRLNSITVKEFRGIRDLTLDFGGKNFAISGPNGTGKSGIVDALEFALTGNVSRLSGEGRGEVSLKQHGPHVDKRNNPDKARVVIEAFIPSLKKTVKVERNLKSPTAAQITPSDPAIFEIFEKAKTHPEIVLSRRELIRYILATPGKRAQEVQALLHLDHVEQVRLALQKIANASEKQIAPHLTAVTQARDNLQRAIGVSQFSKETVLSVANTQRAILGLAHLPDLTSSVSLKDGMAAPGPSTPQRIAKAQGVADIKATREALADITSVTTSTTASQLTTELTRFAQDPWMSSSIKRETFYSTAMELIEDNSCPLCDTAWDIDLLKSHVRAKLTRLEEITQTKKTLEEKLAPLITSVRRVQNAIKTLSTYCALAVPPIAADDLTAYTSHCTTIVAKLGSFFPLLDTIAGLGSVSTISAEVLKTIDALDRAIAALPEPTKQDAARDWLTIAQERLDVWREATRKLGVAKSEAETARKVYDTYARTSDKVLTSIYCAVEKDFAFLYGFVNRDDEGKFTAKLIPSMGKLGFDVDFYGRGYFPPGAYHSEGHQDGMGLCLYLALMRHIHGAAFTISILDDVLMSVDAAHRREVCTMLKQEFPDTQFIITTHDPIWLRHMRTERIIGARSAVQFRAWTVDSGPTRWDGRDVWAEIENYCNQSDVRAAAALLRNYIEYESAELCHRLRASVEFRADAQHQLGELLPPAIIRMRDLFVRAKEAANSWNQRDVLKTLAGHEAAFCKLASASNAEQWQINVAIHYNSWENLTKADFLPVVAALRALLDGFSCPNCSDYLRVSPERETPECFRCECGAMNFNLREKGS